MSETESEATRELINRLRLLATHTNTPWAKRLLRKAGGMPAPRKAKPEEDEKKKGK